MKNTIFVTETMKTFNTYQNDYGFISGSLGGNITTQLGNIADLFEKAGVPLSADEWEWLEIAIVNCSPNTIGFSN